MCPMQSPNGPEIASRENIAGQARHKNSARPNMKEDQDDREPWERLSGELSRESSRAYTHFCLYRDMPQRSLRKLVEDPKCISKIAQLRRWSARYQWVQRAELYDDYTERLLRLEQEKERRQMAKRHASIAVLGQTLVVSSLQRILDEMQLDPGKKLSASDLSRLLDVSVRVERMSRGEASEITEVGGSPGRPLLVSVEEVARKAIENVLGLSGGLTERIEDDEGTEPAPADATPAVIDPLADPEAPK